MSKFTTKNEVRLSYTNLLEPRAQDKAKPDVLTYSTAILIPKSDTDTVEGVQAAIKEALTEGVLKEWGGKTPGGLRNPLRDGDADRPDDPNYAGHYFINAKGPYGGKERPALLDGTRDAAETESAQVIYSGVYARVSLQFFPYDKNGNRGIGCGVSAVLSSGKGEPLANTVTAASARDEFGVATPASDAAKAFASDTGSAAPAAATPAAEPEDPWAA